MSKIFVGKVALVTGAGSGIGRAIAIAFASAGADLVLAGRDQDRLQATASEIEGLGRKSFVIEIEVTDEQTILAMMNRSLERYKRIDYAINCVGIVKTGGLVDTVLADFIELFRVNTLGTWLCMKHEINTMKQTGGGKIINIGSNIGAALTRPNLGVYGATKAAVVVLTKTAALEALDHGIYINVISPGPVDTPLSYRQGEDINARNRRIQATNPSKRVAKLSEVADLALWLCSHGGYIVGQELLIDGGASV